MKNYRLIGIALLLAMASAFLLGQDSRVRGVLVTNQYKDESALWVEIQGTIEVGKEVILENSRNDSRETYTVKDVLESIVILEQRLRKEYPAGSRLIQ